MPILLALLDPPSPDLYRRAEDLGITAVMVAPWLTAGAAPGSSVDDRFRAPIERFAETVMARVR
ncbi:hypothetical protein [Mycolicibacterium smegmatis]|uniref:hypothetical protein n=1 Tax=Mycolicibacterium smegmatis TaxID=1772 RepID=UPI0018EED199